MLGCTAGRGKRQRRQVIQSAVSVDSVYYERTADGRANREAEAAVNTRLRQQQRSMPSAGRLMAAAVRK